ncbi:SMI1/KNR4 family protein [Actinoplanes sp. NPDC051494]|uniref:SMI1/KNR4 family protein n=1 Tax=Actinoplanes sp. NPDC051494 TaxID=3363907 RepID=UPI0037A181C3
MTSHPEWSTVFAHSEPCPGAGTRALDEFARRVRGGPDAVETAEIIGQQRNPFPPGDPSHPLYQPLDPSGWLLPDRDLPRSYLALLAFSDGGSFGNGDRLIQLFPTDGPAGVRAMTFAYHLPASMPGALPFAFNGGGVFYLFDMRDAADDTGEYPVVAAHAGSSGWAADDHWPVAPTLAEACHGTVDIADLHLS